MYQMLTGEVPFRGDTPLAVLKMHVEQQVRPIASLNADVPPALVAVVERAMAKEPDDRYSNGAEMAAALREAVPDITPAIVDTIRPPRVDDEQTDADEEGDGTLDGGHTDIDEED